MRSILFCICTFITCAALAQEPDTTYQLLWYKGKKIRTNVLLTPKLDTVFYQPSKGLVKVVSKTGSGKRLDNIMIELARTPQRMNQMMQKLSGALPKPLAPYYAIHVKNAYTQVQEDLTEAISNTIVLPGIEPVQAGVPQSTAFKAQTAQPAKDKHPFDGLTVADVKNLPLVKEILEYHEKVKNETITWVPAPPRNDLTYCLSCDSTKEKQFDHDFKVFRKEFFGSDEPIFIKILAVMREAELLMNKEERDEVRRLLNPVFEHIMARLTSKAMLLAEKYADDPYRGRAVAMMVLSIERQRQLLGLHDGGDVLGGVFMRTQEALKNLVDKAISEYDYTIALDVRLILATERQFQLLGGKGFDLDRVLGFNQFKMKLDISGKVEGDGGYILAHLRGDNWVAAVPNEKCKLKWILLGPDIKYMKAKVLAAEMVGNGVRIDYVGTKNFESAHPKMRLDFCSDAKDTVEIFSFHAEGGKELWLYPVIGVQDHLNMSAILLHCFLDVARAKQKAAHYKNTGNIEKLKKDLEKQFEEFKKNSGGSMDPSKMSAKDVEQITKMARSMEAKSKVTELIHEPAVLSYLLQPEVQNRNKEVFKAKLNGRELFPENPAIAYAWLHLSLEQDPNSPYKLNRF